MEKMMPVEEVLLSIEQFCAGELTDEEKLYCTLMGYMKNNSEYKERNADTLIERGRGLAQQIGDAYYFLMSFLLQATLRPEIYKEFLQHCIEDQTLTKENKYYLYNQLKTVVFLNGNIMDEDGAGLLDELYGQIYAGYQAELGDGYHFIPKEERNYDFVMVMGTQLIGIGHGPTKTLYDRCFVLDEYMKKKVFIINTAEFMSIYQAVPFFDAKVGGYEEAFSELAGFEYQGKRFEFFQCPREMPQVPVIKEIMDVIQSEKPYFIVTIGDSLVGDLCSKLVPVIGISTVPSSRMQTRAQFQVIGRKVNEDDKKWIKKHGFPEDHMIESLFTSAFRTQTHHYTRKELGLPEHQFVVLVVGARLDKEINEACMEVFYRLTENGLFIAFMGVFDKYPMYGEKNECFKQNSAFLGFQDDVLAVNECCDVYLNPKRVGGGTSCAEALYKGLPVVTLNYGDVGLGAGEDFHVSGYEEMVRQIVKYSEDKEYYQMMSEKAKKRAERLTDSKKEFVRVIQQAEKSQQF